MFHRETWLAPNGNVSAFGKLKTLKLILAHLPEDGEPVLCGFLDTFRPPSKLDILEELASYKSVAVAATLSMAAARHYEVKIPNYALFSNFSGTLTTAVYGGDLDSASDVEDWVVATQRRRKAARAAAAAAPSEGGGGDAAGPAAATDPGAPPSAAGGEL